MSKNYDEAKASGNNLYMDDGGYTETVDTIYDYANKVNLNTYFKSVKHSVGAFDRDEIDIINKRYRFGINTPSDTVHTLKEYLFFTKPDLYIYTNGPDKISLNIGLQSDIYWRELIKTNKEIIYCLQDSIGTIGDHFNHLLGNMVKSHLSIPSLSAEMVDTPTNLYGVGYQYHGSGEASDDSFDFSLEFRDVKGLPVYHFFKAYESYQTLKHHGVLEVNMDYVINKILYDHYSIFKFLVDEDGETIVYYAQLHGVKSKSLPRDVFESGQFGDEGITYTIDFNAAFFDDMKPSIIKNFNYLANDNIYSRSKDSAGKYYEITPYNSILDRADGRATRIAYVEREENIHGDVVYKLKWRGDDKY